MAAVAATASPAAAMPGFFAGRSESVPKNISSHVVIMQKDEMRTITVMVDYKGDLKPFAFVMPVPDDVVIEDVKTMKRDFVDRLDELTAPRFHEFWEMDACEPGKPQQIWEMDYRATKETDFLGMGMGEGFSSPDMPAKKTYRELQLTVEPQFKEGEHTLSLLRADAEGADILGWLKTKGYVAPPGASAAIAPYVKAGMSWVVAEVDDKRVELIGGGRAILSPVRYSTQKPVKVSSTLGLLNSGGKQELYIYVIHPDKRFEVKNYPMMFPPTNIAVDFKVKERMGEFYAGIHDLLLAKNPQAFLSEYSWAADGCGQPCANVPPIIHELLSLGGDIFERAVPDEEKNPKPPEQTEEEKKKEEADLKMIEDVKKRNDEKKRLKAEREEVARRQALLSRHKYHISRMHHRFDKTTLPRDVEVGPGPHVKGGVDLPQGPQGTLPTDVKPGGGPSMHQTRFVFFHPSIAVINCDKPVKARWGKPPRTYRGYRKIWTAQDMGTRDRKSHAPAKLVKTAIPVLGLAPVAPPAKDGGADGGKEGDEEKKGGCGCETPGRQSSSNGALALIGAALGAALLRRRR